MAYLGGVVFLIMLAAVFGFALWCIGAIIAGLWGLIKLRFKCRT